jgi:hypothetical protein
MSKMMEHAKREMELAGLYAEDSDYGGMIPEAVLALVKAHSEHGHSGGSHELVMRIFNKVANFQAMTPLTSNPEEWMDRTKESGGNPTWQNLRQSSTFSQDGGKTWYDIYDPEKKNWPKGSQ